MKKLEDLKISLKEVTEKINNLQDDYDTITHTMSELISTQRSLVSSINHYIVKDEIIGNDGAYAIVYVPKEVGGCGEFVKSFVLKECVANTSVNCIYGKSLSYRYFDGEYSLLISPDSLTSEGHRRYEENCYVYRICSEEEFDSLVLWLSHNNCFLKDIMEYFEGKNDKK